MLQLLVPLSDAEVVLRVDHETRVAAVPTAVPNRQRSINLWCGTSSKSGSKESKEMDCLQSKRCFGHRFIPGKTARRICRDCEANIFRGSVIRSKY